MRETSDEYVQCLWEIADLEDELRTDISQEEKDKIKKRLKELNNEKALLKNLKKYKSRY